MLETILTGAAFGAALTSAGVDQPSVIVSQLTLQNWHMLETFLTAAASSAVLVNLAQRLGYVTFNPRGYSSIGLFAADGNVCGGVIQGIGMALAGACPGTVFAQVGTGVQSGVYALLGTVLGGVFWSGTLRPFIQQRTTSAAAAAGDAKSACLTVDEQFGIGHIGALLGLEAIFVAVISAAVVLAAPEGSGLVGPVVGGLLIGSSQLLSVAVRKSLLGTSSSFEEAGDWFWWLLGGQGSAAQKPKYNIIMFTSSMILGSWLVSMASDLSREPSPQIPAARALLGGALLAVGSRMAGGCTSGHGISGLSLLSVSSFITVAAMFAGGIAFASILQL